MADGRTIGYHLGAGLTPQAISSRLGSSASKPWNTFGAQLRNASDRREGGVMPGEDAGPRAPEIRILLENLVHPVVKSVISSSKGYRTCALATLALTSVCAQCRLLSS